MPDENIDTDAALDQTPPEEGQAEGTPAEGQAENSGDQQLTPEQIIEKRISGLQTWIGRRDAQLLDRVGQVIDQRLQESLNPYNRQGQPPNEGGSGGLDFDFENPTDSVFKAIQTYEQQKGRKEQQFSQAVLREAGKIMDANPAYQNRKLGSAVVEEIGRQYQAIDRNLPPAVAAELLVRRSTDIVQSTGTTTAKEPKNINEGGITPPGGKPTGDTSLKLSEEAAKLAKRFNYTDDDLKKVFKE